MSCFEEIRKSELIPLYRELRGRQDSLGPRLTPLLDRLQRRLFDKLSIEEIERITELGEVEVEELSKKL